MLHFNNNLNGVQGETPVTSSGVSYKEGIFGNGAYLSNPNQIYFSQLHNINQFVGTLEFWIKPDWNGNDGKDHYFLRLGLNGGMLMGKDAGNFWRIILNRWSPAGYPEVGAGVNIENEWLSNAWHHVAFTWNSEKLKVFIDGYLRAEAPVNVSIFNIGLPQNLQLGASENCCYINAVIDELRISNIVRTDDEILNSYLAGISVEEITIDPEVKELLDTWWYTPKVHAQTNIGDKELTAASLSWRSLDNGIASVNDKGKIIAVSEGSTSIIGTYNEISDTITVNVTSPVIASGAEEIPEYLSVPASQCLWEIPVVIIQFLPTSDGINIDPAIADWSSSIVDLKTRISDFNKRVKFMLEEGSRFRGYKNTNAPPSLGYRVVGIYSIYEEMPKSEFQSGDYYFPDYDQILTRINAENYVNIQGVKEFWIWGYHFLPIAPVESNMSSPTTGDVSNSDRFQNDLPIYNKTYTVYNYNFTRTQAEAVHNHGHQLESILKHVAVLQDGNYNLFVHDFSGWGENYSTLPIGRAGDCHHPSNTTIDYDYENMTLVESDIEDWTPDFSGETTMVNANTWGNINYNWPADVAVDIPQKIESQWYIYWMQNMPGLGNTIPYGVNYMNNWWEFTADWDAVITNNLGLYDTIPLSV